MNHTLPRTVRRKADRTRRKVEQRVLGDGVTFEGSEYSWIQFLTPKERKELDLLLLDVKPVLSFKQFIQLVKPEFEFHWYLDILIRVLQEVADGSRSRVMIFMPPRHGKSELVSRLFPAYYLYRHPKRNVGLVSYGAELAYELAGAARDLFFRHDDGQSTASRATKNWRTTSGGGMWADGIGGTLTGKGANLLILDDPTKNAQEAASKTTQRRNVDWYSSTFSSRKQRRQADGSASAIVIVGTRWHENDILGWLLATERTASDKTAERWHVLCFQAIKDSLDMEEWPEWCTDEDESDLRFDGDALNPSWFTLDDLLKEQSKGRHYFSALYQQRPRPREGTMFQWQWFQVLKEPYLGPGLLVMHFDLAGTDGAVSASADYTAGCAMVRTPEGRYIIHKVARGQYSPARRDYFIREQAYAVANEFGGLHRLRLGLEQEAGIGGAERIAASTRVLSAFSLYVEPATKSKGLRAEPLAAQAELGNVWIVEGEWNGEFLDELCSFDPDGGGKHDDMVDAASGAMNKLAELADNDVPLVLPVLGDMYSPFNDGE